MTRGVLAACLLVLATGWALAGAQAPAAAPRFVSQRVEIAYMREGPSYAHKVLWVYRHKGYPLEVVASFDIWRRVRDRDGTVGWMNSQMLSDNRTVLVTGQGRVALHASDDLSSKVVGLADPGAILSLKACHAQACRASAKTVDGWIARDRLRGVAKDEVFK
jgi:SH3-like domain-containing protein